MYTGKISLNKESMAFKPKRRVKNSRSRYLRPGALAQLRYSRSCSTTARSCTDIGKKRVVLDSKKAEVDLLHQTEAVVPNTPVASPDWSTFPPMLTLVDGVKLQKMPATPKTPQTADCDSQSRLESFPTELLVKILCHLHHDQLRPFFHVSRQFRNAVLLARQHHFNYTTPDRSRQEMLSTKTPRPTEHWPFMSKGDGKGIWGSRPYTPKAPRHGPRPPRLHQMDMREVAAVLFQESALPSRITVPPGLPRPVCKSLDKVLLHEDELCQAVAQNKLR